MSNRTAENCPSGGCGLDSNVISKFSSNKTSINVHIIK